MEIYRKSNHDLLRVEKLPNGRLRSTSNGETKSFENYKQFAVHLYNKGFHIAMTDRSRQFAHNFIEAGDFLKLTDLILDNELAFRKDGDIFTGWFLAFKPDGLVELMSNTDFSYTSELGYKAVTVRIDELILIIGDI
ncbi:hypothetical protein BK687P1_00012 [Bacteroides phage BK687P1]|nr:hypothetical protein BK687P1_00012 [Bacteroides phage BK687P1]